MDPPGTGVIKRKSCGQKKKEDETRREAFSIFLSDFFSPVDFPSVGVLVTHLIVYDSNTGAVQSTHKKPTDNKRLSPESRVTDCTRRKWPRSRSEK